MKCVKYPRYVFWGSKHSEDVSSHYVNMSSYNFIVMLQKMSHKVITNYSQI